MTRDARSPSKPPKSPSKPRRSAKSHSAKSHSAEPPLAKLQPNKPRPVTASYLRNAAMHYLASRSASASMVRQTLRRRAKRRLCVRSLDADIEVLIDAAVAELSALGLIDDTKFADGRTANLVRKGLPGARIAQGLRAKGLGKETVAAALADGIDEVAQARRYVERKRLGCHRRGGATPESRKKDLSALARAGFSFAVAVAALRDDGLENDDVGEKLRHDGLVK